MTKQDTVGIRDALIRAMRRTGQMPKNQSGEDARELSFLHHEVFAALDAGDEDHGRVVYLIDRNAAHEDDEKTIRALAATTGLDIPRPLHTDYKHKDGTLCYTPPAEIPLAPGGNQQHAKNIRGRHRTGGSSGGQPGPPGQPGTHGADGPDDVRPQAAGGRTAPGEVDRGSGRSQFREKSRGKEP